VKDTVYVTDSLVASRVWAFDWYKNQWPWKTVNGAKATILYYYTECITFASELSNWLQLDPYSLD